MHFPEWETLWNELRRTGDAKHIEPGAVEWCKRSWENFYSHSCDEPELQSRWEGRLADSSLDPPSSAACRIARLHAERAWYERSCPYFRVWPGATEMLASLQSDLPTREFALPFPAFVVRLPDSFNGLVDSTGKPVTCALIGCSRDGTDSDADDSIVILTNGGVTLAAPIPTTGNVSAIWATLGQPYVRLGQLATSLSYLTAQGDKAVRPDVLSKDSIAYDEAERAGDAARMQMIEERAVRRGKQGFVVNDQDLDRLQRLFLDAANSAGDPGRERRQENTLRPHFSTIAESMALLVQNSTCGPGVPPAAQATDHDLK